MYVSQLMCTLLLMSLFLMFIEFHKFKRITFVINLLILFLMIESSLGFNIWHLVFLSNDFWKSGIIFLVFLSFIVIINLLKEYSFEVIFLNAMVLVGSLVIITCDHLIVMFLGLELQTFSIFALIAKDRISIKSSEGALKYFILGALSSGLFLLGVSFIFSLGSSLNFKDLCFILDQNLTLVHVSMFLISMALLFKLAIFPLHFWIADIYEGSSWEVVALISTIPKISVLSIVLQILNYSSFFIILSSLSIVIGTIGAMNQTKVKRLLAYSGISHMGFILLGITLILNNGLEASFIYLYIYTITMLSLFLLISNTKFNKNFIIELSGIGYINKALGLTWLILFSSLAGIPPLTGFLSKWFILNSLIDQDYIILAILGILFSAIAAGYYLRIVKISFFQKKSSYFNWKLILEPKNASNTISNYLLGLGFYFSIFLILHPTFVFTPLFIGHNYFF